MPSLVRTLILLAVLLAAYPAPGASQAGRKDDVITLKDGRVIRGKVVEFFPNDSTFLIRLNDGTFARFNKADIAQMGDAPAYRLGEAHSALKKPELAWLLSFVVPGAGQIYNDDLWLGVGIMTFAATGAVLYFTSDPVECETKPECKTKRTAGIVIMAATWIGSQIHAPLKASAINREVRGRMTAQIWPEPHPLGVSLVSLRF